MVRTATSQFGTLFIDSKPGGNLALSKAFFLDVANNGDSEFIRILLRARRRVSAECVTQALLPAVTSGSLPSVLLLVQAGADGSFDNASALTQAVSDNRVDLTAALILGQYPPDGSSVDQSLASVFQTPFTTLNTRYRLIEVLLCGCPSGSAANNALLQVTLLFNVRMMILLLAHGADINHNGASAVGHAIQRNRADLVAILLQDQSLMPDVASGLVKQIPPNAPSTDKLAVLSKLLVNGASGVHCSEMLIAAAEQNDLDIAELLVSYHRGDDSRPPVCSVDYNAARCLQVAVARNSLPMVKLLALEGAPLKFSLAKAFSSIPSKLSKDDHFLLVQTLLRAGAAGPEVEAAFLAAVSAQHKSTRLIEVFVHFGANINEQTLLAAVTQGNVEILKVLLSGNVPAATCSAAIPPAMKIRNLGGRFKTVRQLIGPATASGLEVAEISQAVIDIIQSTPDDLPLLSLLCREGKANVNFSDGLVVSEAVKQADARVLEIVLHGQGSSPSPATIDQALKQAIGLPSSDSSRERKVEFLLRRAKPQTGINEALIREIKSASESQSNISVIRLLLEAGADVNASEGGKEAAPICWAVTRNVPELLDLILSKQPLARSLSLALPLAMTFQDPARYNLCEKLLRTGAVGDEVSKALCKAAKEGAASLPLLQLLLPQADVNFKDGLPLRIAVRHGFFELVDLLLAPRPVKPSSVAKAGAFQEAMKLKSKNDRHKMVDKLLKAGMGTQVASEALLSAVNAADIELVKVLLKSGASVEHRGGIAIRSAASCGETAILKTLVDGELCSKPTLSTLTGGFGGALTIKDTDKDAYHLVIQTLLNAGMRGEAVDEALIHAVQEGDSNIRFCELLYDSASVEWKEGEAVNIAVQIFAIKSLALLLRKQPTENTLKRAYRSTLQLPKEQRYQTIELILKAGKAIDKHVAKTLTTAAMETPSDRRLITLLLSHGVFDEGEAIVHTAGSLDLRTLTLLLGSPKANGCLADAFKEAMKTDLLWKSSTGLAIMKLMLKKGGASGEAVGEALYQAIEKSEAAPEGLASEFLDVLLESGADVNYQRGLALQRAAMQVNIPLLEKLLPSANSESKAMAIPYIFICCDDRAVVLKAIQMFERSFVEGDPGVDITFTHPDTNLEPLLFMALDRFPRDTTILEALLQMGYHANQWQLCEDTDVGMEPWPILFWALDRPEKKISSATIELLIDEGGKFLNPPCLFYVDAHSQYQLQIQIRNDTPHTSHTQPAARYRG
jgi:ankyrin repeat protein